MKTKTQPSTENTELVLSSDPADLLETVRSGKAVQIATKPLNIFYVKADAIEKAIKSLKEKCRGVIVNRRDEGEPTGTSNQHRTFVYHTPSGDVSLTVQERMKQNPDPNKLEKLLRTKNLWEGAQKRELDLDKVDGMCRAGLITQAEMDSVCYPPEPQYALIAKFDPSKGGEA